MKTLTSADETLWQAVTDTVLPLKSRTYLPLDEELEISRQKSRSHLPTDAVPDDPVPNVPVRRSVERPDNGEKPLILKPSGPRLAKPVIKVTLSTPSVQALDRKARDKITRGRVALEARIDLHGMTQEQAYRELRGFIANAHRRGLRWVLVITGKGSGQGERGILRRVVPKWLGEPDFRSCVNAVGEAAPNHGGAGALYVRLKRRT